MTDPAVTFEYIEETDPDGAISQAGFSRDDSKSSRKFRIRQITDPLVTGEIEEGQPVPDPLPITLQNLTDIVIDLLGSTDLEDRPGNSDGRISRITPKADPVWQNLYATGITSIRGVGKKTDGTATPSIFNRIISKFCHYPEYVGEVDFAKLLYNVLDDQQISCYSSEGHLQNDNSDGKHYPADGEEGFYFRYAEEYNRYTQWIETPTNNFMSAQLGGMKFRTTDALNNTLFQDGPKLLLPDSVIQFKWWDVPYRYLTDPNSYLTNYVGTINEFDFLDWEAGSLLYLGAIPEARTPPIQQLLNLLGFNFGVNQTRICDLTLNFVHTRRLGASIPASISEAGGTGALFSNKNRIPKGHNLFPNIATRKFYYITSFDSDQPKNQDLWEPYFNAFPHQMLFTDPQTNQPDVF